jgi:hypothetical protein
MIERKIIEKIEKWLEKEKILILKGSRQVGKTTLLFMMRDKLKLQNKNVEYFSCDKEISNPLFTNPKALIKYIQDSYTSSGKKLYIFIDEFQYIENAGMFLKIIFDAVKDICQIVVSGSSSLEITKNSEYLTGRKVDFMISGIVFQEFVEFKERKKIANDFKSLEDIPIFLDAYQNILKARLSEYLGWSAYPEVITETNLEHKFIILKEIVSTYIQKDIAGYLKVHNIKGYNNLINILANQIGSLVNVSELSNTINLNHETLKKYLDMLEGTYLLDFVKPYYTNARKEITKMPKVYVNDIGIYNLLSKKINGEFDYDNLDAHAIENYVYLALKNLYGKENINFYRTISKSEIDFILSVNDKLIPIEVKFARNIKQNLPLAIKNFEISYPTKRSKKIIITKNYFNVNTKEQIFYIPVYSIEFILKWLVEN